MEPVVRTELDERMERAMGGILRAGVLLSAAVVLVGGVLYLRGHAMPPEYYHLFRGEPAPLRSVHGIVADAGALRSPGVVQLGVLLLLATPVARVMFALLSFVVQRDRVYILATLVVLGVLLYSMLGAGI